MYIKIDRSFMLGPRGEVGNRYSKLLLFGEGNATCSFSFGSFYSIEVLRGDLLC